MQTPSNHVTRCRRLPMTQALVAIGALLSGCAMAGTEMEGESRAGLAALTGERGTLEGSLRADGIGEDISGIRYTIKCGEETYAAGYARLEGGTSEADLLGGEAASMRDPDGPATATDPRSPDRAAGRRSGPGPRDGAESRGGPGGRGTPIPDHGGSARRQPDPDGAIGEDMSEDPDARTPDLAFVDPDSGHRSVDLVATLPSGTCEVVATAMVSPDEEAARCHPASREVTIAADTTSRVSLNVPCEGEGNPGGPRGSRPAPAGLFYSGHLISATPISATEVELVWQLDGSDAGRDAFQICYRPGGWSPFICYSSSTIVFSGSAGEVTDLGSNTYSYVVGGLSCNDEYTFNVWAGYSWIASYDFKRVRYGRRATTFECGWTGGGAEPPPPSGGGCDLGVTSGIFDGEGYVITGSVLENSSDTCRSHVLDYNGDQRDDVLRTCDDSAYNALFEGTPAGFAGHGYVLTGSVLQNSTDFCRLHVLDFNGDQRDDLLKSCNNPVFNALFRGTMTGFSWVGTVMTGSMLQNSADTCRVHVLDFDGDGRDDLLRSCNDPAYNALFQGTPTGFIGLGYVMTGSMLQNSTDTCRLHVLDYDGDGRDDLLRSCNNPAYNALYQGTPSGFIGMGYVMTGSMLQNSADTCRLHVLDFNGDTRSDLLRSCDDPAYNALFQGTPTGFIGLGYVITGSVLQNSGDTCRLHVSDFNGDSRDDLLRSCDNQCFNAVWYGGSAGFVGQGYVMSGSLLQNSASTCRLHIGNYDGVTGGDLLRSCDTPSYNALWRGLP